MNDRSDGGMTERKTDLAMEVRERDKGCSAGKKTG